MPKACTKPQPHHFTLCFELLCPPHADSRQQEGRSQHYTSLSQVTTVLSSVFCCSGLPYNHISWRVLKLEINRGSVRAREAKGERAVTAALRVSSAGIMSAPAYPIMSPLAGGAFRLPHGEKQQQQQQQHLVEFQGRTLCVSTHTAFSNGDSGNSSRASSVLESVFAALGVPKSALGRLQEPWRLMCGGRFLAPDQDVPPLSVLRVWTGGLKGGKGGFGAMLRAMAKQVTICNTVGVRGMSPFLCCYCVLAVVLCVRDGWVLRGIVWSC